MKIGVKVMQAGGHNRAGIVFSFSNTFHFFLQSLSVMILGKIKLKH